MRRFIRIAALILLGATACGDGKPPLRAKIVQRQDELIGGRSAKAKLGDFLIENDRIKAIVGGTGPGWAAGVFGGTLLDVDRHRWQSGMRDGHGYDAFSEAFPLANLLVVNPADPKQVLRLKADGFSIDKQPGSVAVLKDGSDGKEAIIRVQ